MTARMPTIASGEMSAPSAIVEMSSTRIGADPRATGYANE